MKRSQLGGAIFLLIFGIFICVEARKLEIGQIVKPGPGFFPFWLGFVLVIVSLTLMIKVSRRKVDPSLALSERPWEIRHTGKILFSSVAMALYALFLEDLGYILSTFFLMVFLFRAIGSQRWLIAIGGPISASLITYLIFKIWLQVQLPAGFFGM